METANARNLGTVARALLAEKASTAPHPIPVPYNTSDSPLSGLRYIIDPLL